MMAMSYDTAKQIYKKNYWAPIMGDDIKNQSIANIIYDTAVNAYSQAFYGVRQALKNQNVKINGADIEVKKAFVNSDIINALNKANQAQLFDDIKKHRETFYTNLNSEFTNAWLKRVAQFAYTPTGIVSLTFVILASAGLVIWLNWDKFIKLIPAKITI